MDETDWEDVDQNFHSGHHQINRSLDVQMDCERGSSLTYHHPESTGTIGFKGRGLELYLKLFWGPWIHFLPRIMLMPSYIKHCVQLQGFMKHSVLCLWIVLTFGEPVTTFLMAPFQPYSDLSAPTPTCACGSGGKTSSHSSLRLICAVLCMSVPSLHRDSGGG